MQFQVCLVTLLEDFHRLADHARDGPQLGDRRRSLGTPPDTGRPNSAGGRAEASRNVGRDFNSTPPARIPGSATAQEMFDVRDSAVQRGNLVLPIVQATTRREVRAVPGL